LLSMRYRPSPSVAPISSATDQSSSARGLWHFEEHPQPANDPFAEGVSPATMAAASQQQLARPRWCGGDAAKCAQELGRGVMATADGSLYFALTNLRMISSPMMSM